MHNQQFQARQISSPYIQSHQPQSSSLQSPSNTIQFQTTKAKVTYWRQDQIYSNIQNLDNINQKLLKIADSMTKTSFMDHQRTIPTIIVDLQNDLRTILTELIANVKQFFIDIDCKLKTVVQSIERVNINSQQMAVHKHRIHNNNISFNQLNQSNGIRNNPSSNNSSQKSVTTNPNQKVGQLQYGYRDTLKSDNGKFAVLSSKVEALQINLKRTQSNQEKLMEVIAVLMDKYKINEQPTIIRDDPALSNHFSSRQKFAINVSNGLNLQANGNNQNRKEYSIHQKLYTLPHGYQESQVTETLMPKSYITEEQQQEEPQQYIRKIYAKNQLPPETLSPNRLQNPVNKKSLKSTSTIQMQKSSNRNQDKSHRLTFMMNNLRQ